MAMVTRRKKSAVLPPSRASAPPIRRRTDAWAPPSREEARRSRRGGVSAASLLLLRDVPGVGEGEELERVQLHVPDLLVHGRVVGEGPEERVGLLVGQARVQLLVDGA